MPTLRVDREELFVVLGKSFTDEEFDELCFDFGIELDEVETEAPAAAGGKVKTMYAIALPANRPDLLCIEGLGRSLKIFMEKMEPPTYVVTKPANMLQMHVKKDTQLVRPYVVAAVLRGLTFTPERYASFIDLQDKLHHNIGRKRTLVAIGTHDLDTLSVDGPFSYEARPPQDISFVPLSQSKSFRADQLMAFYKTDPSVKHIKPYTEILSSAPVYPCIYDCKGTLLSLPPIINGEHSKISLSTKNVLIECTGTDLTKAKIVLNTIVCMFSEYCESPFTVEPVQVSYEQPPTETERKEMEEQAAAAAAGAGGAAAAAATFSYITPDLSSRPASCSVATLQSVAGVAIPPERAAKLASRMQLPAVVAAEGKELHVQVPPTRSDVLHECDIVEDVCIAHGYNNIPRRLPSTVCSGAQQPINRLTDQLRMELAMAGFDESLTLALCAREDCFEHMLLTDPGNLAVVLANPQTEDFQIGRVSMVPGLLKSLESNRSASFGSGIRLFEVSDVMLLDPSKDVGARNERRLAALYSGPTAGFEVIHGLADRVMQLLEIPNRPFSWQVAAAAPAAGGAGGAAAAPGSGAAAAAYGRGGWRYWVEDDAGAVASYFPGRAAKVMLERLEEQKQADGSVKTVPVARQIGTLGVLHPKVLANFHLDFPASVLEICIEQFVL